MARSHRPSSIRSREIGESSSDNDKEPEMQQRLVEVPKEFSLVFFLFLQLIAQVRFLLCQGPPRYASLNPSSLMSDTHAHTLPPPSYALKKLIWYLTAVDLADARLLSYRGGFGGRAPNLDTDIDYADDVCT